MEYKSYRQIDAEIDELYAALKFQEALELLCVAREQFPEFLHEIIRYEIFIYIRLEDYEKCLLNLEEMVSEGFFIDLEWKNFDPLRSKQRFKAVSELNTKLREDAQKKTCMKYQVHTPDAYDEGNKYPLFIGLHGDSLSMEYFISQWKPAVLLEMGYLVLYIQSSQIYTTEGYGWTENYEMSRKDIKAAYNDVISNYSIDSANVIIGGFSGGSIASIEAVMADIFPIKGFISLCPSLKPDSFTSENVIKAVERKVRGVILEGETEGEVPEEQEMIQCLQENKFPLQLIINPGIGHAFPVDFPRKLADAITFITD